MSENSLIRLQHLASDVLPGQQVETRARGEDYYIFEITSADGAQSALPPIWIDTDASDQQIKEKLSYEFERAFHPESSPDDLSVPNLQTEANRPKRV